MSANRFLAMIGRFDEMIAEAQTKMTRCGIRFDMRAMQRYLCGMTMTGGDFPLHSDASQFVGAMYALGFASAPLPDPRLDANIDVLVSSLCAELDRRSIRDSRGIPYREHKVRRFVAAALGWRKITGWPRRGRLCDAVQDLADRWQHRRDGGDLNLTTGDTMDAEIHSVDKDTRDSEGNIFRVRGARIAVAVKRIGGLPLGEHKDQHYLEVKASSWEGATNSTLTAQLNADDLQRLFEGALESKIIDTPLAKSTSLAKCCRSRLDRWESDTRLAEVRRKLKESREFEGSWERFLDYVELPRGRGLTKDTTIAQTRPFAVQPKAPAVPQAPKSDQDLPMLPPPPVPESNIGP